MWAIANALKNQGITTFNGKMVDDLNWKVDWFGTLDRAEFAMVMPCAAFWSSEACVEELQAILQKGIPVFILRVCLTFNGSVPEGNFLGSTTEQQKLAGFFRQHSKLRTNCLPTPSQPLFHENFEDNCQLLWRRIVKKLPHLLGPQAKVHSEPEPETEEQPEPD